MSYSNTQAVTLLKNPDVSDLAGEKVMVDFASGKYFLLKGAANEIWELIQTPTTVGDIINSLLQTFDTDEATCAEGVYSFLHKLEELDFIKIG